MIFIIISHKQKFIFIKCRKTASTSMEILLEKLCGKNDIIYIVKNEKSFTRNAKGYTYHRGAFGIKKRIGSKIWNEYFKFCFVRNPFDMLVSYYHWRNRFKLSTISKENFCKYVGNVKDDNFAHNYNLYTINDRVVVDFIGRYENLKQDVDFLFGTVHFPKKRVTRKIRTYREFYNKETRLIVEEYWKKELDLFKYKF